MSNIERDLKFIWEVIYQFYKVRNLREVSSIVRKYGMDHEDVYQVACMSYLHAEERYKPTLGKFHTFAGHCIKSQLKRIARDFRTQKRNTDVVFIYIDDQDMTMSEVLTIDDYQFEDLENVMTVNVFLEVLSKDERFLVLSNYANPKTQTEIARSLGINQITVSRRVKKAVAKMREVAVG